MGKKASFQKVEQQQQQKRTKFLSLLLSSSQSCSKKKRVDTRSQKDEKRRRRTTTTTPGGCFDATLKKRTDRRNRRHDFPELKFVQDGGFTGGIETNLRAFSARDKKNESLRSVHKREIPQVTDQLTRMHSTLSKRRTRPRDEARRPMFHRIGSPRIRRKKSPLPFRPVGALRPPLFARAIQNPIRSLIIIIENDAGLFDLTTRW